MLTYGARERTFLVSKEFAVNGALRNGAAVNREILAGMTQTVIVNQTRDNFLTHATLACDEH